MGYWEIKEFDGEFSKYLYNKGELLNAAIPQKRSWKEMSDEEIIELDDPSLAEPQQYDPEADRDAFIPPPELDGQGNAIDYLFKLSLGENKFGTRRAYFKKDKNGNAMGILMVDVKIVDPGGQFDNVKINPEYLNTYVDKRTGTNGFVNMSRLLGNPMPTKLGVQKQAEHLEPMIGEEPFLGGRLQWSAYCTNCEDEIKDLKGERSWPEKEGGGHIPLAKCPDCKQEVTPKVNVRKFISISGMES